MLHARLGMVIAKKYLRRAIDRNRIKRQIRESFRHNKQTLRGFDMVVLLRSDIRNVSNSLLRDMLKSHWEKAIKICAK